MALPTQTEMNGVVLWHMVGGAVHSWKAIRNEVVASPSFRIGNAEIALKGGAHA